MYDLPLFPLNTVLFPGTPIELHIFEERYKEMIEGCIESSEPFGVVLIRKGQEALGALADPFPIGCTAQIIQVQSLPQGRMNISAIGRDRFRILDTQRTLKPYLVGKVASYPLERQDAPDVAEKAQSLDAWLRRYLGVLIETGKAEIELDLLPGDPVLLAYTAAALLQVPPLQKQKLLALPGAPELLAELVGMYRRESALLRYLLREGPVERSAFSRN